MMQIEINFEHCSFGEPKHLIIYNLRVLSSSCSNDSRQFFQPTTVFSLALLSIAAKPGFHQFYFFKKLPRPILDNWLRWLWNSLQEKPEKTKDKDFTFW